MRKLFLKVIGYAIRLLTVLDHTHLTRVELKRLRRLQKAGVNSSRFMLYQKKWLLDAKVQTVIDIGANVGEFTAIFAELFPHATIYAFEPLPECYTELRNIAERYGRIQTFNIAVGAKEGVSKFYRSSWAPASSFREMNFLHKENYPHSADSEPIEVTVRPLDQIFENVEIENDIFIKMDVQGYEDEVIEGGCNTIKKASIVVIECSFKSLYSGEPMFDGIYNLMRSMGFEYQGSIKQSVNKNDGSYLQADCIFVRKA